MTHEENLGLKIGLEIHQQLEGKKLFCACPTEILDREPEFTFERKIRAVAGELGDIDQAAQHEHQKEKTYRYQGYRENTCLVEMDEEPPHPMNKEALKTTLMVAKTLNATVVDEIQIMRKTVVDGSNVSGFQRTALVGMNGSITTSEGVIRIPTLCLEEDSAKIVEKQGTYGVYNLSRLGFPLIEIGTSPDIKTPKGAQEAAAQLGMILRSTGRVKRGLGTIRQDINVSIKGGARIEIKGAQDLKLIPTLIGNEIKRQRALLALKQEAPASTLSDVVTDLTSILKGSPSKIIQKTIQGGGIIGGCKLAGFAGLLGRETQPGKRLGTELSEYGKVKAGVGGLFHSDELPNYGITPEDVQEVRKALGCSVKDAFILVCDQKDKVYRALAAAVLRASLVKEGVPSEVRNANPDGTSSYLRPMPGAARMYPETDVESIGVDLSDVPEIELLSEQAEKIEAMGLSKDLATLITKSNKTETFLAYVDAFENLKPAFIAEVMLPKLREVKRKYNVEPERITDDLLRELFVKLDLGKIPKEAVEELLVACAKTGKFSFDQYTAVDEATILAEIKLLIKEDPKITQGALMGRMMARYRGKVDGKKLSEMIGKVFGQNER